MCPHRFHLDGLRDPVRVRPLPARAGSIGELAGLLDVEELCDRPPPLDLQQGVTGNDARSGWSYRRIPVYTW
jgi:hypothetical protein